MVSVWRRKGPERIMKEVIRVAGQREIERENVRRQERSSEV